MVHSLSPYVPLYVLRSVCVPMIHSLSTCHTFMSLCPHLSVPISHPVPIPYCVPTDPLPVFPCLTLFPCVPLHVFILNSLFPNVPLGPYAPLSVPMLLLYPHSLSTCSTHYFNMPNSLCSHAQPCVPFCVPMPYFMCAIPHSVSPCLTHCVTMPHYVAILHFI